MLRRLDQAEGQRLENFGFFTPNDPFNSILLKYRVLQRMGYPVEIGEKTHPFPGTSSVFIEYDNRTFDSVTSRVTSLAAGYNLSIILDLTTVGAPLPIKWLLERYDASADMKRLLMYGREDPDTKEVDPDWFRIDKQAGVNLPVEEITLKKCFMRAFEFMVDKNKRYRNSIPYAEYREAEEYYESLLFDSIPPIQELELELLYRNVVLDIQDRDPALRPVGSS